MANHRREGPYPMEPLLLFLLLGLGACLLLVGIAVVAWLNWNPKVGLGILSSVLIGASVEKTYLKRLGDHGVQPNLPAGVEVLETSSSEPQPYRRLVIRRPLFFEWTIAIALHSMDDRGWPVGWEAKRDGLEPVHCGLLVESTVEFSRWTSENHQTNFLKEWQRYASEKVFKNLPS